MSFNFKPSKLKSNLVHLYRKFVTEQTTCILDTTLALDVVFSECFGFPCQFLFHEVLHFSYLSSKTGTIRMKVRIILLSVIQMHSFQNSHPHL
jgi:hypothetical protein